MTYTPMASLKEFHDTFAKKQRKDSLSEKLERRQALISEEFHEVRDALEFLHKTYLGATSYGIQEAAEELVKELADLLYVVYGTAEELGFDLETAFNRVHTSNMSKIWDDGTVHYNEFGKVLKPPTYSPPSLKDLL